MQPATKPKRGAPKRGEELRTDRNKKKILKLFGTGATWAVVEKELGCHFSSVQAWMNDDPAFKQAYREAREESADFDMDKIREIGLSLQEPLKDDDGNDLLNKDGEPIFPDRDAATRARTTIEALKISSEKRAPRRFGPLLKVGGDEDLPLQIVVANYADDSNNLPGPVDGGLLEAEDAEQQDEDAEEAQQD